MNRLNKTLLTILLITGIIFLVALTAVIITDELRENRKENVEIEKKEYDLKEQKRFDREGPIRRRIN